MTADRTRRGLDARVPPPLVLLIVGLLMWVAARAIPGAAFLADAGPWAGAVVAAAGMSVVAAGALRFRRVGTTIDPTRPENASALVQSGIYRVTRNPMYLGFALMLAGWALVLGAAIAWLGPALFVAYIQRFQIVPEKRALRITFGAAFEEYTKRVRRWI